MPGLPGYFAFAGLFLYTSGARPLADWLNLFAVALLGEGMGAVIVYSILIAALFTRDRPWRDRATPALIAAVLVVAMVVGAIKG
ncbi:hypothetical protein [Methylobacterium sp. A54F]